MKKLIYFISLTVLFAACSGIQVVNVKYAKKISKNYMVYALPRNVLAIDVEVTEVRSMRGPYSEYAEKYMGIQNVPQTNKQEYFISNSDITLSAEPDSNNYYFVFPKCSKKIKSLNLTDNGILLSINSTKNEYNIPSLSKNANYNQQYFPSNIFTTLSQKEYVKEIIDTVWKQVKVDTSWVRVPVQKKTIEAPTFEDKAKEAAHHIMRLRKRLFKLLSGAYNKLPEVKSAEIIITELRKEEEEYLSLFIGKTYTRKYNYRFLYYPAIENCGKREVMAFLYPEKGLFAEKSNKALPLIIEVNRNGNLSQLDTAISKHKKASTKQGIVYRIPEMATINLSVGNNALLEKQFPIAQFGILNNLPVNSLKGNCSDIEFNPLSGNITKTGK
ncbi:MAG: DUF4831 family protein [Bacteroidia bacterium]|nr:DUF4831 family protein [Bacteroidia bacterium]